MRHVYPWAWVAWAIAFGVLEGVPLVLGKPRYTLSDYVWRLEEISRGWTFARYLIGALCLWLFLHLTFGILR